ncbi:hypothetical protein GLOIN_2v1484381 [Rhizophagus irregularis DAOM 181602=DAOM 197198]|nr:hypothetical protein GLOIN_2v1484381 [Rhizophagus irregularis DAOM 181602=DAOM 197198]
MRWDYKVDFSMSLVDIEMAIEKDGVTDITQLGGFCETLFEMVTYTIIRQGGDFQVHKLTDDGTQSECEINGFDYLEENFFDNVEEIQGPVKYY